jgi:hypothetical protein
MQSESLLGPETVRIAESYRGGVARKIGRIRRCLLLIPLDSPNEMGEYIMVVFKPTNSEQLVLTLDFTFPEDHRQEEGTIPSLFAPQAEWQHQLPHVLPQAIRRPPRPVHARPTHLAGNPHEM